MLDNESKRRVCFRGACSPPLSVGGGFENGRVPSVKVDRTRAKRSEGQRYAQGLNSDENSAVVKGFASSTASLRRCSKGFIVIFVSGSLSHLFSFPRFYIAFIVHRAGVKLISA